MKPSPKVIEAGAWVLENGHRALLALTGGRFPKAVLGMVPVELRVVGRKSGQPRTSMLTAPVCEDDRVVLIASKGGHPDNPQWYENLVVNPDVELLIDGEWRPMRARTAEGTERTELWDRAVAAYKGYAGYQRNTDRQIPVVVCEPRA